MKARDLNRLNGVEWWEIDQAEEKKFITTEQRKPATGRPSKWAMLPIAPFTASENSPLRESRNSLDVQNVNQIYPTKLLPSRYNLDHRIKQRHWDFAFWYAIGDFGPDTGPFGFKRRAWTAYMKAYQSCYSKAAARSSASRLLKRPEVRAAIAWHFANLDRLHGINRFFPRTATEVWDTLHRLGSDRARWAPHYIKNRWIVAGLQANEPPAIFK